jgi:outer membrane protein TolC
MVLVTSSTRTLSFFRLFSILAIVAGVTTQIIPLKAQAPSQSDQGPSHASQQPFAGVGPPPGSVSIQQSTTNTGQDSVLSISGSVTVNQPFNGSSPTGTATTSVLSLTLADAFVRGLRSNLGILTENASVKQAEGERVTARSALIPSINAAISEEFERLNLRTMGVESSMFPTAVKFNYFDARAVMLNEPVFDLVKIDNLKSAGEVVKSTIKAARDSRDLIVLAVAGSYLQLIATQARISAARAEITTSRAVSQQADDRLSAGLAPRIDATRSRVQLQTEQERLRSLEADFATEKLRLARIIGLPLGQQFTLVDHYLYSPVTDLTEETVLHRAMSERRDLQSAADSLKAAENSLKAAHAERVPSLAVTADFGAAGPTPSRHSTGVYSVYGTLTIPIFEGGRIHGEIEQAVALVAERQAAFDNLRGQVDEDVRQAFIDLNAAADQVGVAKNNVDLAHDTLTQSRDRFAAGVADTVELVQAEQTVVQADNDYITAVFQHNLAKVSLARAIGKAEQALPQLLRKEP